MTTMHEELARLGEALESAADENLKTQRPRRMRPSRRLVTLAAALAVAVPAASFAAVRLIGGGDVAQSMPAGAAIFEGRNPTCTPVVQGVEYHCVLDRAPAPEVTDFTGTKEATVDSTKHVNGGCVGLTADGMEWECYLGNAAVEKEIISAGFLGQYAPSPGHG